jgi:sugar/nucleoside kinase (ribokinase family)
VKIAFVGHLSIDVNIVDGKEHVLYGGGVLHGSVTAARLGAGVTVYTACAAGDRSKFAEMSKAGVQVVFLPSEQTTSIRNYYPGRNPDERISSVISRARPFSLDDLSDLSADAVHLNPLWFGEIRPEILPAVRGRTPYLAADAQGFLRHVASDGSMVYRDFEEKGRYLPLLDLLKVDEREARIMTGSDDYRHAALILREMGAGTVLLTHRGGVCVCDAAGLYEAPFGEYSLEGRTGRGDTCTAAFLVASRRMGIAEATRFAAEITSRKMHYPGPYRGDA